MSSGHYSDRDVPSTADGTGEAHALVSFTTCVRTPVPRFTNNALHSRYPTWPSTLPRPDSPPHTSGTKLTQPRLATKCRAASNCTTPSPALSGSPLITNPISLRAVVPKNAPLVSDEDDFEQVAPFIEDKELENYLTEDAGSWSLQSLIRSHAPGSGYSARQGLVSQTLPPNQPVKVRDSYQKVHRSERA